MRQVMQACTLVGTVALHVSLLLEATLKPEEKKKKQATTKTQQTTTKKASGVTAGEGGC